MNVEFLPPYSLDECAYHLHEWIKLENQRWGWVRNKLTISTRDENVSELSIQRGHIHLLKSDILWFGIVGMMQKQDSNTTLIKAQTRVAIHPVLLLHSLFFYLEVRQVLVQFRGVFTSPKIGGVHGYRESLSRIEKQIFLAQG